MALLQPDRMSGDVAPAYVRHKPEQTLLYQLVEQHWPEFQAQLNETGRFLPRHVTREFEDYLACGRLEKRFSTRALPQLQPRASRRIQLQTTRVLHQLWCQTHGGDRCASSRSCPATQTCASMGT